MRKMIGVLLLVCAIGAAVYGVMQAEPTATEEVMSKANNMISSVSSDIETNQTDIVMDQQKRALPYYVIAALSAVLGVIALISGRRKD